MQPLQHDERHAAYCDTCQRFDEAMKWRLGKPRCSFCGTALPGWGESRHLVPLQDSEFIHALKETRKAEQNALR